MSDINHCRAFGLSVMAAGGLAMPTIRINPTLGRLVVRDNKHRLKPRLRFTEQEQVWNVTQ